MARSHEQFVEKAREIHGDKYDYPDLYVSYLVKIDIYCKACESVFNQVAKSHLQGHGCYTCGRISNGKKLAKSLADFIQECKLIHKEEFDYSRVVYKNMTTKVEVGCLKCKKFFLVRPDCHIRKKVGCPDCRKKFRSEEICREALEDLSGTRFPKARPTFLKGLELDGYCEDLKMAFEYNGEQHYKFVEHMQKYEEIFERQQERDEEKRRLCQENGVYLITIPYRYSCRDEKSLRDFLAKEYRAYWRS